MNEKCKTISKRLVVYFTLPIISIVYLWVGCSMSVMASEVSNEDIMQIVQEDKKEITIPTGLKVDRVTEGTVELSWQYIVNNEEILEYTIYRDGIKVGNTYENKYVDKQLTGSTSYKYTITSKIAYGHQNESGHSVEVIATTNEDLDLPTVPTNVTTCHYKYGMECGTKITWHKSQDKCGIKRYEIYRDGKFIQAVLPEKNFNEDMMYIDTECIGGTHDYKVRACDTSENFSEFSEFSRLEDDYTDKLMNAKLVDLNYGFYGDIESDSDIDCFKFKVSKTDIYSINMGGKISCWVGLYNDKGESISNADNSGNVYDVNKKIGFRIVKKLEEGKEYYIAVYSSNYNETGRYNLILKSTLSPNVPQNLQANNITEKSVELTWKYINSSDKNLKYNIYRNGVLIAKTEKNNYKDDHLDGETEYLYTVKSNILGVESKYSNEIKIKTKIDNIKPEKQSSIYLEGDGQGIRLTWQRFEDNCNIKSYQVYKNSDLIYEGNNCEYIDNAFMKGKILYKVRACDTSGNYSEFTELMVEDDYGNNAETAQNINNIAEINGNINYKSDKDYFTFQVKTNGKYYITSECAENIRFDLSIYDSDNTYLGQNDSKIQLQQGKIYYLSIEGEYWSELGEYSIKIVPTETFIDSPKDLIISNVNAGTINLAWKALDNCDGIEYKIYRNGLYIAKTKETKYEDKKLTGNTEYSYSVTANKLDSESEKSNLASAVTYKDLIPPKPSMDIQFSVDNNQKDILNINWKSFEDECKIAKYEIYKDGIMIGITNKNYYYDYDFKGRSHSYKLRACDTSGNWSEFSKECIFEDDFPNEMEYGTKIEINSKIIVRTNYEGDEDWLTIQVPKTDKYCLQSFPSFWDTITHVSVLNSQGDIIKREKGKDYSWNEWSVNISDVYLLEANMTYHLLVKSWAPRSYPMGCEIVISSLIGSPINLIVKANENLSAILKWDPAVNNTGRNIEYRIYCDGKLLNSTTDAEYIHSNLDKNKMYRYKVTTWDPEYKYESEDGESVIFTLNEDKSLNKPLNLKISGSDTGVEVSWQNPLQSSVIKEYEIYRDGIKIGVCKSNYYDRLSYKDTEFSALQKHVYKVRGCDICGNYSGFSDEIAIEDDFENTLTLAKSVKLDNQIRVKIDYENDYDCFSFQVDKSGMYSIICNNACLTLCDENLRYLNSGFYGRISQILEKGKTYFLSTNISNVGEYFINVIYPPEPPRELVAEAVNVSSIKLTWKASTSNDKDLQYKIYRDGIYIASSKELVYLDDNLSGATIYRYTVTSEISGAESQKSNWAEVTTMIDNIQPSAPQNVSTTSCEGNGIKFQWKPSVDDSIVELYEVYRDGIVIGTTREAVFKDYNFTAGEHVYKIRACDTSKNWSDFSQELKITDDYGNYQSDATLIDISKQLKGNIDYAYDIDYFKFKVDKSGDYAVIQNEGYGSNIMLVIEPTNYWDESGSSIKKYLSKDKVYYLKCIGDSSKGAYSIRIIEPPLVPQGLKVTGTTAGTVSLSWNDEQNHDENLMYNIYRNGKYVSRVKDTKFTDIYLQGNTTYQYRVTAYILGAESENSNEVSAITIVDTEKPDNVKDLRVYIKTGSSVVLRWTAPHDNVGATRYEIYRDGQKVGESQWLEYTDKDLVEKVKYSYTIKAFDTAGNSSEQSNVVEAIPLMPHITRTTPSSDMNVGGYQKLELYFLNTGNTEDAYATVEYLKNDNEWVLLKKEERSYEQDENESCFSFYVDLGEFKDGSYKFRYTMYDAADNVSQEIVNYIVDSIAPDIVENIKVESDSGNILLTWDECKSSDFKEYRIYRKSEEDEKFSFIKNICDKHICSYIDPNVVEGKTYLYKLIAVDVFENESVDSEIVTVKAVKDSIPPIILGIEPDDNENIGKNATIIVRAEDNTKVQKIKLQYSILENIWNDIGIIETEGEAKFTWDTSNINGKVKVRAIAIDKCGNESDGNPIRTYIIDNEGPDKVIGLDYVPYSNSILLKWKNVNNKDFSYFQVERKDGKDGKYKVIGKIYDTLGMNVTGLNEKTAYWFRVIAYDIFGNRGIESDEIMATTGNDITAPVITSLQPSPGYYSKVIPLKIGAKDDIAIKSIKIEISTDEKTWTEVAKIDVKSDDKKNVNVSYDLDISSKEEGAIYIRAIAEDDAGHSSNASNTAPYVEYRVDHTAPSQPKGLKTNHNSGYILLEWDEGKEEDLKGYNVYRSISENGVYEIIAENVPMIAYRDRNTEPGTNYYYKIAAVDAAGNTSLKSNTVYGSMPKDEEIPEVLSVTINDGDTLGANPDISIQAWDNYKLSEIVVEYMRENQWILMDKQVADNYSYVAKVKWDTTALQDGAYKIRIIVKDASGNESKPKVISCNLNLNAPKTPILKVKPSGWSCDLSWECTTEDDFNIFKVYRSLKPNEGYEVVYTTKGKVYKDNKLLPGRNYYYKIEALDIYNNSSFSEVVYTMPEENDSYAPTIEKFEDMVGISEHEVQFDGSIAKDNDKIVKYQWNFGDGSNSNLAQPRHVYNKSGEYEVTLSVFDAAGNIASSKAKIQIHPKEISGDIKIRIVDKSSGAAISGASVIVQYSDGKQQRYVSDSLGHVNIVAPEGKHVILAYKHDFKPAYKDCIVEKGSRQDVIIAVERGAIINGRIDVRRMELDEIIDAGININSSDNQWVYSYEIHLGFNKQPLPPIYINGKGAVLNKKNEWNKVTVEGHDYSVGIRPISHANHPEVAPAISYLVIPSEVSWLKEFFNVSLNIINQADEPFTISDSVAQLFVPDGLSIMNSTVPEDSDIKGGETKQYEWIIRGDKEGTYDIEARFDGVLQPFGEPVSTIFKNSEPIKVYGDDGLEVLIEAEDWAFMGKDYKVYITLKNTSDRNINNVSISIKEGSNYIIAGASERKINVPVLETGEEVTLPVILVPQFSDVEDVKIEDSFRLDLSKSFIINTSQDGIDIPTTITTIESERKRYYQKVIDLSLVADPIDTATGAHIIEKRPLSINGDSNLNFDIKYNSGILDISTMGKGWTHDFEKKIEVTESGNIIVHWSASFCETYYKTQEGKYIPIEPTQSRGIKVIRKENGAFELELKDNSTYVFDNGGKLIRVQSRIGKILSLEYDNLGRLIKLLDEDTTQSLKFEYNNENFIVKVSDKSNRAALFEYDENKNLIKIITPDGKVTEYTYDDNGHVVRGKNELGTIFTNIYDNRGRVISQDDGVESNELTTFKYSSDSEKLTTEIKDRNGNVKKYIFDRKYNIIQITDETGNVTKYEYDVDGNKTKCINAQGNAVSYTYDKLGNVTSITDADGSKTAYTYDNKGNLITIESPSGIKLNNSYNDNNLPLNIMDKNGNLTTYLYDEKGHAISKTVQGVGTTGFTYENGMLIASSDYMKNISKLEYDEVGRLAATVDREGNTIRFQYDVMNNLISVTDALGNTTSYTYDMNRNKLTKTDANGNTTTYSYNGNKKLTKVIDPLGKETCYKYDGEDRIAEVTLGGVIVSEFVYDKAGRVVEEKDGEGNTTSYIYDSNGRVICKTSPSGGKITYTYTPNGKIKTVMDSNNNSFIYDYDIEGRMIASTDVNGNKTEYSYDNAGNLISSKDALGNIVTYTYDVRGNKLTSTDAKGNTTSYSYDANGNLILVIDALGNKTGYEYDREGKLVTITNAKNGRTTFTYDANGRVISATDEDGRTVTTEYDNLGNIICKKDNSGTKMFESIYDALGNIIKNTDALGNSTTNNYDNLGRLIEIVDKMGRTTKLNYDNDNRLIEVTDPLKGVTKQSYNADGNVKTMTDANNNSTTFDYDLAGNLIRETTAMGSQVSYGYNSRNLLSEMINGRGQNISYEYDALGRIIKTIFPEGVVSYSYDVNGNITEVTDKNGTIKREYDALNRVTKYIDARGKVISYEYDELGNLINIMYPDGKKVYYEYSAGGKLEKVTDWAKRETKYKYDANGRLTKTTRANGTVETLTYDAAGQITEIVDVDKDGNIINRYTFQYDANGNVIKEDKGTSSSVPYIPDDVTMTYDSNNRLITCNGKKIQYDADGNMITVPLNGEMVQCTYDSRNRLIKAGNTTYVYDAENNRIAIVENGQETYYTVNVLGKLSQVLVRTDANGNDTYYVYGLGLIAQEDSYGNYRTYHYDRRGSTTAITGEEGKITDRIEYGPYGELLRKTGITDTPFLYNGRYGVMTDSNGLYYMRARYYNPDIKRFVNQDVVLGSIASSVTMNRYAYANGNPISNIDPFGLSADGDGIIHGILDVLGMAPVVGNLFDAINTGYYFLQGDLTNAALSSISFIPFGDIVGKGTKWGKEFLGIGTKYADDVIDAGRNVSRYADDVVDAGDGLFRYSDDAAEMVNKGATGAESIFKDKISIDGVKNNLDMFRGKSVDEIAEAMRKSGYDVTVEASTRSSSGAMIIRVNNASENAGRNIQMLQVSPGGGRHGELPYIKISTTSQDVGKIKIVNGTEDLYKASGEKNVTVIFTGGK
ncbi:RHS repeat-associated core domain-containing protein [Hathewaya proteolytica DSM 3090]|uniref:RHS repeat-associated core domain-containing protein n=1 Tax=Hathewaya proteolytica DSM 3090 TaxID=1121331 RepID=A0A1M6MEG1_9CLOT|nr:PKD domain-containing protein [Hathewaya proteolytica]SHJ81849.1 RHS repeat-associated core domain-containing protein [Hathewaya proteolytica DSM 3090]